MDLFLQKSYSAFKTMVTLYTMCHGQLANQMVAVLFGVQI